MIFELYKRIRRQLHDKRIWRKQANRREEIIMFIKNSNLYNDDKKELLEFFGSHCFEMVPYLFRKKYDPEKINVKYDAEAKMNYVLWHEKRMYWKRNVSVKEIQKAVNNLFIEQDANSPHKYFAGEKYSLEDHSVADFGAAEGCFALDIVEKAEMVYLFEADPEWIEALERTFTPWKHKIEIVSKFIGGEDKEEEITVDSFFKDKKLDYVKADIEGAEVAMLQGGEKTFKSKVKAAEVCAYHNVGDERKIETLLEQYGFSCLKSKGYLFFRVDDAPMPNCFRKGIVWGRKKELM